LGTDPAGSLGRPNEFGIVVAQSDVLPFPLPSRARIGGTSPSQRNVISGNLSAGVLIGVGASETVVAGNYIGTDSSGMAALGAGILISGNGVAGVRIAFPQSARIEGNLIGTDHAGKTPLGNGQEGLRSGAASIPIPQGPAEAGTSSPSTGPPV
jgi:hypothetical protein